MRIMEMQVTLVGEPKPGSSGADVVANSPDIETELENRFPDFEARFFTCVSFSDGSIHIMYRLTRKEKTEDGTEK